MPEKWTKRSRPPSSGVMKPKPLSSENHLTVPVLTDDAFPLDRPSAGPVGENVSAYCGRAQGPSSGRRSAAQRLRRGGDLVPVARPRRPGQAERVAGVARDHVQVEVEDRLPRRAPARVQEVDA